MSNRPSLHQQYMATMRNFQEMYNAIGNTNESFAQDEKFLTVDGSTDTFTVSDDTRFGKVVLVTTYSPDPNAVERSIDFFNIKDLNFENWKPANYEGEWFTYFTGGAHSAERMGFFYDPNGTLKVKISPKPQQTSTYKVRFSIGDWAKDASLSQSPILTQYHHLFEVRTCKDILYMCSWDGLTNEERLGKIKEIMPSLNEQEFRYVQEFQKYLRSLTTSKMVKKQAWDEW
jgi:hypothetical protein